MRAVYRSPAGGLINAILRAFEQPEALGTAVEVEVLALDSERGKARIRQPLPDNCIINIARRSEGLPPLSFEEREVPIVDLDLPPERAHT